VFPKCGHRTSKPVQRLAVCVRPIRGRCDDVAGVRDAVGVIQRLCQFQSKIKAMGSCGKRGFEHARRPAWRQPGRRPPFEHHARVRNWCWLRQPWCRRQSPPRLRQSERAAAVPTPFSAACSNPEGRRVSPALRSKASQESRQDCQDGAYASMLWRSNSTR
jgi:hypothetical protein